jgi:hypothetical protein
MRIDVALFLWVVTFLYAFVGLVFLCGRLKDMKGLADSMPTDLATAAGVVTGIGAALAATAAATHVACFFLRRFGLPTWLDKLTRTLMRLDAIGLILAATFLGLGVLLVILWPPYHPDIGQAKQAPGWFTASWLRRATRSTCLQAQARTPP